MKDFKNFSKSCNQGAGKDSKQFEKNAQDFVENRKNSSQDQLMNELLQNIQKSKADGSFDEAKIQNFAKQISPMMTPQQRAKLNEILKFM